MEGLGLLEAVIARSGWSGARVEIGVLIERENAAGVGVAEDVATLAAVMPSVEIAKGAFAGRVVANGGFGVRLWVQSVSKR